MKISVKVLMLFIIGLVMISQPYTVSAASSESETLLAALNSRSSSKIKNAAKIITRSGRLDAQIYEKAVQLLQNGYADVDSDSKKVDELSWLCKVVASAGEPKYKAFLLEVAENTPSGKLEFYANQSIELIADYAERNQIMGKNGHLDPDLTSRENQYVNMLQSDNTALVKDAAKLICRSTTINHKLYDVVAEELTGRFREIGDDREGVDALAWLCKALGGSGDTKYLTTLQLIATTGNWKLARNADSAIEMLQ